jgi:hypothetical protein
VRRRTAAVLAHYSERSRDGAGRSTLARAAWRSLSAAAGRGDPAAIEAIWQAWLRHPDDERWELLTQCRGERALAGAVLAAVIDPARAATSRSVIGAFCVRRGIVPDGGAERALLHLMAGQPEQYRAADPDGSALDAAYQAAAEPVRAALRQAMADSGELDLVRVIATRGGDAGVGAATEAERAYLAAELARRRDWPRLWRLALDLPLAEAVAAVRRLPAGWRPADEAGRQLLTRLAAASEAGIAALAAPAVTRMRGRDIARYCRFAPDGSEMAVAWSRAKEQRGVPWLLSHLEITLHGLPGGHRLETFPEDGTSPSAPRTLHFGAGAVFATLDYRSGKSRLIRYVPGHGLDELTKFNVSDWYLGLAAVPAGFVVALCGRLLHGTAEPGSPLRDVTPPGLCVPGRTGSITHVASEPRTGRLAVVVTRPEHVPDSVAVLSPDFQVLGHADFPEAGGPPVEHIGFCGPERLITCQARTGRLWSWEADPLLAAEATTVFPGTCPKEVQPLPSAGLIVIDTKATIDREGRLRPDASDWVNVNTRHFREYLDAGTLRPVACPAVLEWARQPDEAFDRYHRFDLSPDGEHAALSRWVPANRDALEWPELEVRNLIREEISELVRRPLAHSRPACLSAVAGLLAGRRPGDQTAVAVLRLLRACLEYRFGTDVAVGGQPPTLSADDIAVSPG